MKTPKTQSFICPRPSRDYCEDYVHTTNNAAWVIDGTSGTTGKELFNGSETPGEWYVRNLNRELTKHINDNTLKQSVKQSIEGVVDNMNSSIKDEYYNAHKRGSIKKSVSVFDLPGAAFGGVRWDKNTLEVMVLADVCVIVETVNGVNKHIQEHIINYDQLSAEKAESENSETNESVNNFVKSVRQLRDNPGGYWHAGINPVSAENALIKEYDINTVKSVYIFSDGLYPITELFNITWEEVPELFKEHSLETIIAQTRQKEQSASYTELNRRKKSDDIGVVVLDFKE